MLPLPLDPRAPLDQSSNTGSQTGRFRMLREWEADIDPPAAAAPAMVDHGVCNAAATARLCGRCEAFQPITSHICLECGEPWEQVAA